MSGTPSFSAEEIKHRELTLLRCFECCDVNGDGVIDERELEAVARAFTSANTAPATGQPNSDTAAQQAASAGMNVDQEVRVILGKLDRNSDGLIDREEWVSQLNELFRFMNSTAFEKHAAELLTTANHIHTAAGTAAVASIRQVVGAGPKLQSVPAAVSNN